MNILALTYWSYKDALVQTCTLPYLRIIAKKTGRKAYLVTLEAPGYKLSEEEYKNARKELLSEGIILIVLKYYPFGLTVILSWFLYCIKLIWIIGKNNISYIHCWAMPAGGLGYILSKVTGKKLVIDCVEPHAEAMVENGTWKRKSFRFRALFFLEKCQIKRADQLFFNTEGMKDYCKSKYGVVVGKYYVKPSCVDLSLFSFNSLKNAELVKQLKFENKIVCVYAGKFGGIYLEDETFAFIKKCEEYWGADRFRFLLLSNVTDEYVGRKSTTYGILPNTINCLFIPHFKVPEYMGLADFAICPVKPVLTKQYCSPIKNGEYWAMGLPVAISPGIGDDSSIIKQHDIGAIIETFDNNGYLNAIHQIDSIIRNRSKDEVYKMIRPVAEKYRNFSIAEKAYSTIYTSSNAQ
jgi:glycosyltransferase involved in cell wall biosynthesis